MLIIAVAQMSYTTPGDTIRKRIEEVFGWAKTCGTMRKTRHRWQDRVGWSFTLTTAAYNLVRLPKLLAAA